MNSDERNLLADVMTASLRQTQEITNLVIDNLENDLRRERARNQVIVADIEALLSEKWMPTPDAIRMALYPLDVRIKEALTEGNDDL